MIKKVLVLMSTYNGEIYLREQIESLVKQTNVEISILVRDDGSTDNTIKILDDYQNKGILKWYTGNNLRPAKSFMDLVEKAPNFEYYAFCDQDDVWLEDKLEIAIKKLEQFPKDLPALYYGRPRLVDSKLNLIKNPKSSKDCMLTYGSSIINSNATGCTMVFNKCLLEKVKKATPDYIPMHDAWFHKICIISSGKLYFDDDVHILYRQHGNNAIGISNSRLNKIKKHFESLRKKKCSRSRTIQSLYNCYKSEMSKEDKQLSELVINYKRCFKDRMKLLFNSNIKTNYIYRNILFRLAVLFKAF